VWLNFSVFFNEGAVGLGLDANFFDGGLRSVAEVDHLGISANTGVKYAVVRIVEMIAELSARVGVNWEKLLIILDVALVALV